MHLCGCYPTRERLERLGEEVVIWTERFTVDSLHALHAKVYQLIHQHRHEWDKTRLLEVRHITSPLPLPFSLNHNTHSPKRLWLAMGTTGADQGCSRAPAALPVVGDL